MFAFNSDYSKQLNDPRVLGIDFNKYPDVSRLTSLINEHKKTLEQEALMDEGTREEYDKIDANRI